MRLTQLELKKNYLYEGLDRSSLTSVLLWEHAGQHIKEAALTPDQINGLFAEIEKAQTAAGGNRTMLGKGKDATMAVNKAWEDLKTQIQNSGPVKGWDKKVSDVLSKIGMGAADPELEGQVSGWVQKYRDFAKKHPIIQGALYATLIAAAGISGAGVGGAAVLGLLKMADKMLQGEKFSSAAYAGAKTGALAYGASKLGDYLKGEPKDAPTGSGSKAIDDFMKDNPINPGAQKATDALLAKYPPGEYKYLGNGAGNISIVDKDGAIMATQNIAKTGLSGDQFANYASAKADAAGSAAKAVGKAAVDKATSATDILSTQADAQDLRAALSGAGDAAAGGDEFAKAAAEKGANQVAINKMVQAKADAAAAAKDAGGEIAAKGADAAAGAAGKAPYGATMDPAYLQKVVDAGPDSGVRFKISADDAQKALDYQADNPDVVGSGAAAKPTGGGGATLEKPSVSNYTFTTVDGVKTVDFGDAKYTFAGLGETPPEGVEIVNKVKGSQGMIGIRGIKPVTLSLGSDGKYYNLGDSVIRTGRALSEGQVYLVFNRVCARNDQLLGEGQLVEGPLDAIKGFAGKAMDKVKTAGHNLTTKVTADKLNSAWQKAGSPTDAAELKTFLTGQGVNADVVDGVYKTMKIDATPAKGAETPAKDAAKPGADAAAGAMPLEKVKELIMKLPTDRKARLLTYLMGGKKAMAAKPAPAEDDNPNIVRGTESIQRKDRQL